MYVLPAVISVVFGALLLYYWYSFRQPLQVTFERLQQLSGADVANFTQLRLLGTPGSFQTVNGSWELLQDLDNSWMYSVRVLYISPRGQAFQQVPLPSRTIGVCDLLASVAYKSFWDQHQYSINYPDPKNRSAICPFSSGAYFLSETGVKMFKLYFVFNLVCIYLAIKSAFSAEVPDPNEQKISNYLSSAGGSDDDVGKRASAMWFGPRLGKRTVTPELHDDLLEELDGSPMFYQGEAPQRLAADIAQGSPYLVLLVTAAGGRIAKPQPVFYHSATPRLGRRDASAQDVHSRPPFAPRLGRNLPFSPRLGRSFGGAQTVDSFGF
ncbi:hypothetical protein quinque_012899 [Culex quinquefasciatus]